MRELSTEAKLAMMAQAARDFIAMDNTATRIAEHKLDGAIDCVGHMQMEFLRQLGNFTQDYTVTSIPGLDITLEKKPT